jgi:hypothetical protein
MERKSLLLKLSRRLFMPMLLIVFMATMSACSVHAANQIVDTKTEDTKVKIAYEEKGLYVECGDDKVSLDRNGLKVNNEEGDVDISLKGIHVNGDDGTVDIGLDGIHVKNDTQGDSVDLDFSGIHIDSEDADVNISLPDFLSDELSKVIEDVNEKTDWLNFDRADTLTLLNETISVNGENHRIKISIKDGYLITMNCSEEYTSVSGLTLEKTETDGKGNVIRYYQK